MSEHRDNQVIQRVVDAARARKLDRRQFMSHVVAAGMTAAAASTLWTDEVSASTPKRGGTFKVGSHDGNTSDTHDPGTYLSFSQIQLAHSHRSFLTEITPENGLGPDMADGWEASDEASVWTFELNKNATFHNGRKFTAKDAVASLNHHRGKDTTSAAASLLSSVTDIKADGDHVVRIELEQGFADLPWIMTDYHLVMLPANEDGTLDWQSGIGAGPYRLVEHEPGIGSKLERHDGWHREGAYFDGMELTILNDPNARQTALITGDVDVITDVDLKTLAFLKRDPNIEIDNVPSGAAVTLPMFCDVAPFNDVNVRLALKHAIDREEIVKKIRFGTATVGNDYHISPTMPYWPDLPQRAYDPDKARHYLKQAGMSELNVSLSAAESVSPGAVDLTVLFSEQAKRAGINIKPVREPNDGYWADVWLKKPFVFVAWGARPTPDMIFSLAYKNDAPWNESHWQNERFNELLLLAKKETNQARRAEMYHEMSTLMRDDGGTIIPYFNNFVYAHRKSVAHADNISASWQVDGARGSHRWWFKR